MKPKAKLPDVEFESRFVRHHPPRRTLSAAIRQIQLDYLTQVLYREFDRIAESSPNATLDEIIEKVSAVETLQVTKSKGRTFVSLKPSEPSPAIRSRREEYTLDLPVTLAQDDRQGSCEFSATVQSEGGVIQR